MDFWGSRQSFVYLDSKGSKLWRSVVVASRELRHFSSWISSYLFTIFFQFLFLPVTSPNLLSQPFPLSFLVHSVSLLFPYPAPPFLLLLPFLFLFPLAMQPPLSSSQLSLSRHFIFPSVFNSLFFCFFLPNPAANSFFHQPSSLLAPSPLAAFLLDPFYRNQ